ncbi:MAG: Crp/Fnr family transcriptional regulator [Pseudomonadota bacterium]|nr:Crp/Fnr family transcriptional regulator [Pseudomonadota bacterium]
MLSTQNHLIEILPRGDRRRLLELCEPIALVLGKVICDPATPTRHVYFPIDGFISLVAVVPGKPGVEVGMVGREGMLGSQLALGVSQSPLHAVVQGAGSALRIGKVAFRAELVQNPPLQRAIDKYIAVVMAQLATSAVCLRFHEIGPRLARWLLMSQDRAHSDTFEMTHEFLSYMLGVRRVGITVAAGGLQRSGLIEYRRGVLTVLDRPGLRKAACGCYALDQLAYAQQFH